MLESGDAVRTCSTHDNRICQTCWLTLNLSSSAFTAYILKLHISNAKSLFPVASLQRTRICRRANLSRRRRFENVMTGPTSNFQIVPARVKGQAFADERDRLAIPATCTPGVSRPPSQLEACQGGILDRSLQVAITIDRPPMGVYSPGKEKNTMRR